ncbi:uncharacterized protein LOC124956562 [Vespa velutina]|uniref:uncharacterized protein LOC124956562 n=1 Tax=Vespa velutina TaxID=202808 RepID=UPI001FB47B56|nr:uncharacterized protein LOC124956562 [Vespa velutina]
MIKDVVHFHRKILTYIAIKSMYYKFNLITFSSTLIYLILDLLRNSLHKFRATTGRCFGAIVDFLKQIILSCFTGDEWRVKWRIVEDVLVGATTWAYGRCYSRWHGLCAVAVAVAVAAVAAAAAVAACYFCCWLYVYVAKVPSLKRRK